MRTLLQTLLAPLALAIAGPALAAPVVNYEVSIPVSAVEAAFGAGVFDAAVLDHPDGNTIKAERLLLRVASELSPVGALGFPAPATIQAGDGINGLNPPLPTGAFTVKALLQGVSNGLPAVREVGDLGENLSTDADAFLIVKDIFNGVAPGDAPALLGVQNFLFFLSVGTVGEDPLEFELDFLQASDEVLAGNPFLGGASFLRLDFRNQGTRFTTSDFDIRLTGFSPDGEAPGVPGQGGNTVPEPASLGLAITALALTAHTCRRRRAKAGALAQVWAR